MSLDVGGRFTLGFVIFLFSGCRAPRLSCFLLAVLEERASVTDPEASPAVSDGGPPGPPMLPWCQGGGLGSPGRPGCVDALGKARTQLQSTLSFNLSRMWTPSWWGFCPL